MKLYAKIIEQLGCIMEEICVGGNGHGRIAIVLFFSSRRNFKFLRAKKEAQQAFVDGMN
jgi:hypothetical protein